MSPRTQKIVNAQTEINRAVFEANMEKPRDVYIVGCLLRALKEIIDALLTRVHKTKPKHHAHRS